MIGWRFHESDKWTIDFIIEVLRGELKISHFHMYEWLIEIEKWSYSKIKYGWDTHQKTYTRQTNRTISSFKRGRTRPIHFCFVRPNMHFSCILTRFSFCCLTKTTQNKSYFKHHQFFHLNLALLFEFYFWLTRPLCTLYTHTTNS